MSILLPLLLTVLMIAVFASLMREGLWSNIITFFNVVFSGLLAFNFFEPLASFMDDKLPSGTMFWDLIALWVIFAGCFGVFKTVTDNTSKVSVRFKKPIDQVGGYFFAAWTSWVLMCFLLATLHTAPMSREFFFGGFRPESAMYFGMKPDRLWLGWVQSLSRGAYERMQSEEDRKKEAYVFDAQGEFMPKYATRRSQYERTDTFTGLPSTGVPTN